MYMQLGKSYLSSLNLLRLNCWAGVLEIVEDGSEISGVSVAGYSIFQSRYCTVLGQVNTI